MRKDAARYVERVKCPRCGLMGTLMAVYKSNPGCSRWYGPYFRVNHHETVHDAKKYHDLRSEGMSVQDALNRSHRLIRGHYCYFSTRYPSRITREVRGPRDNVLEAPRGEAHHAHKLTESQVQEIRRIYRPGQQPTQYQLAHRFGVSRRAIGFVVRTETWTSVTSD